MRVRVKKVVLIDFILYKFWGHAASTGSHLSFDPFEQIEQYATHIVEEERGRLAEEQPHLSAAEYQFAKS